MQDNYVGDIGDYGKYGLLRAICSEGISLSVNWYKVTPKKLGHQDDGKYIGYLSKPQIYRVYDCPLFDSLHKIICVDNDRRIQRVERENLFPAKYFSEEVTAHRADWHQKALRQTLGTDAVFLDPDNGLETLNMFHANGATEKHVKWSELKDYYDRGQNVILYQHRAQMDTKEACIDKVLYFQYNYLKADCLRVLEFPKCANRFYFIFIHKEYQNKFEQVCNRMVQTWGKKDFCRKIDNVYIT